jgi:hypothetical protein
MNKIAPECSGPSVDRWTTFIVLRCPGIRLIIGATSGGHFSGYFDTDNADTIQGISIGILLVAPGLRYLHVCQWSHC